MPLPRRTQRQESYFQAHALGWRDGELEGWLARQLYMKRPASQAQGMPTQLPQAGADGGAAGGQGGLLAPSPPRDYAGAWISFHKKNTWGEDLPTSRLGETF